MRLHSIVLALALVSSTVGAQSIADSALDAELQRLRDAFSQAYVNRDFAAMAAMYTPDAALLPTGGAVYGREAIERFFTYGPNRVQVAHSMTPKSLTVHGNVAVELGVWSSTVRRGDGPATTVSGRHMLVWERQRDGRWLLAYDAWHQPPSRYPEPQLVQDTVIPAPDRNETWPSIAERLPAEINDSLGQQDLVIAPDESWMIVVITDHPQGLGGDDLFLSRRTTHGWTPLEHFPAPINSAEYEHGPSVSPDGLWLHFTSHRRGTADVYRVPLRALGLDPIRPNPIR